MSAMKTKTIEEKAVDRIYSLAKKIFKAIDKYRFSECLTLLTELGCEIENGSRLPGANPDPYDYRGYPPERKSTSFSNQRPPHVVALIEATIPLYACNCLPIACDCFPTEDSEIKVNGVLCWFCKESLPRFTNVAWLTGINGSGAAICDMCNNILFDKLKPEFAAMVDISNLILDACNELPFLQFDKAMDFAQKAKIRAAEAANGIATSAKTLVS